MLLMNAIVAGLCTGAVYGLVALGYNLTYNSTGVFNLAQGDLVMVGVMLSWVLLSVLELPFILAFVMVVVAVAIISVFEERVVVRPFLVRGDGNIGWFISTLGFSIIIETVVSRLFGNHPIEPIPSFLPAQGFYIADVLFVPRELLVLGSLVVMTLVIEVFLRRTRMGLHMRATSEDRQTAALRGVNPNRISQYGFLLGGVVAGVAGFAVGPLVSTSIAVGLNYSIKGFVALAVGGFGRMRAGVVAALVLGVAEKVFDLYVDPKYEMVVGLVLLMVVLAVKPTGASRSVEARRV
jgi:branched-chain amino acid transport system permease protein